MSEHFIELTEDEFDDQIRLVTNHINPSAGWAYGDDNGCLFETFGEEFAFVIQQDARQIWTLVDGDDEDMYIISGFHFVNRLGYFISLDPVPDGVTIQAHIPCQVDDEDLMLERA